MDRRVKKSRAAIHQAFISLLNQKSYESITVQEIIDLADVGRSTFYSHFETKEIATLLLAKNTYFINRLKIELERYLFPMIEQTLLQKKSHLPDNFLKNYVTSTFVETVSWWLQQRNQVDEDAISH